MSVSYAKGLVDLAEEKSQLEQVHADVDAIGSLLKENQKLKELLFNPVVDGEKKRNVLSKIGKEAGFQKYTMNFLNLLVQKDRINLLDEICESFEDQYCQLTDTQVGCEAQPGGSDEHVCVGCVESVHATVLAWTLRCFFKANAAGSG